MRYYTAAAFSAIVAVASAAPVFTNTDFNIKPGEPFKLTFTGCESGGCKIDIVNGESSNLKQVEVIASSVEGTSTTITLNDLPTDEYAFRITDAEGETNYSKQFEFAGSAPPPTSSAPSKTASASSAASSAQSSGKSATGTKSETGAKTSTGTVSGTLSGSKTSTGSQTASMTGTTSGTTTGTSTTGSSTGSSTRSQTTFSSTKSASASNSGTTTAAGSSSTSAFSRSSSTSSAKNAITTAVPGSGAKFASPLGLVAGAAVAVAAFL